MYYLMQEYEKADLIIRSYVSDSEEWHGEHSNQVLCGLILLSNNCIGWGQLEASRSVLEQVKVVSERCSPSRDPLLEGLYDLAVGCQNADDPTNEQRGFILSLMALSWCVRYASDDHVYTQYAPRLKSIFEAHGFVDDRWEWLIQRCKHNLHDLVGLISILLEKRILPSEAQPPLTVEIRDEVLTSLVQEFPIHRKGEYRGRELKTDGGTMMLTFICPMCGSRDLRTVQLVAYYPASTLEGIEVDSETLEFEELHQREDPFEWIGSNHNGGWEFWCHVCHLVPNLKEYGEYDEYGVVITQEDQLVRWLFDNCPQTDECLPVTDKDHTQV